MAVQQSIPPAMTAFLEFLHSEPFCCLLSHLTGLDLAENVIRTNMTEEKWEEPCSSTNNECQVNDRRDSGGDGNEVKQTEEPQVAEIKKDGHTQEQQGISRSILSTQLNCSLSDDDTSTTRCNDLCTSANSSSVDHHVAVAKVRGELLYFWPGDYTLVSDQDPSIGQCELHLHLHFCCDGEFPLTISMESPSESCQEVYVYLFYISYYTKVYNYSGFQRFFPFPHRLVSRLRWYESVCGQR